MKHKNIENCIILLMGIAGSGKHTVGEALSKKAKFRFVPSLGLLVCAADFIAAFSTFTISL